MAQSTPRHILLIGLEFVEPIFSGNGILTHSIVRGLLLLGYTVTVICAQPSSNSDQQVVVNNNCSVPSSFISAVEQQLLHLLPVSVPSNLWKRLDKSSAWKEMAQCAPEVVSSSPNAKQLLQQDSFVFCIDWSATSTYESLQQSKLLYPRTSHHLIHFVFRVFALSQEMFTSPNDWFFYRYHELRAIRQAEMTVVLSHVDQKAIQQLLATESQFQEESCPAARENGKWNGTEVDLHVLVPPLRNDMLQLIQEVQNSLSPSIETPKRRYITCNVRLSPEKNAIAFAKSVRLLSDRGIFRQYNLQPLLIGPICDEDYASRVRAILPPETVLITNFLQPKDLLVYMKQSILLVHPPVYDAYGMSIAEAAAVGTPSLIHYESIGASSLFSVEKEEILTSDMSCPFFVCRTLLCMLEDQIDGIAYLSRIGTNAQHRALAWTTLDYAKCVDIKLKQLSSLDEEREYAGLGAPSIP